MAGGLPDIRGAVRVNIEERVIALEQEVAKLRMRQQPPTLGSRRRRWDKRELFTAIQPLRATGASWESIGAAVGVCGERCRQVWRLFGGSNIGQPADVDREGASSVEYRQEVAP
jgi:hypothetical protein